MKSLARNQEELRTIFSSLSKAGCRFFCLQCVFSRYLEPHATVCTVISWKKRRKVNCSWMCRCNKILINKSFGFELKNWVFIKNNSYIIQLSSKRLAGVFHVFHFFWYLQNQYLWRQVNHRKSDSVNNCF